MPAGEGQCSTDVKHVEAMSSHDFSMQVQTSTKLTAESVSAERWCCRLEKQLRHEGRKLLHAQLDFGLYGRDWRVVYGGSSVHYLSPCAMLVMRGALFVTHLVTLNIAKFYDEMQFFTTWGNVVCLLFLFTSTLLSIASIGSLSRERRLSEDAMGVPTRRSPLAYLYPLAYLRRADEQYESLNHMSGGTPTRPSTPEGEVTLPPLRSCFVFRRPFSGLPRMLVLETLLTIHDVVIAVVLPMVIIVCLVYWTLLFPKGVIGIYWISFYLHIFCTAASWLVAALSRFPYRLSLLPLDILLGLCYTAMIAIMQKFGIGFVYWFMDFENRPALASSISLVLVLICTPLFYFLSWVVLHPKTAAVDPPKPL